MEPLDGDLPLMAGPVGEHRLPADVTDGKDLRVARPLVGVDLDEPLGIHRDGGVLEPQAVRIGAATDGHKDP